MANSLESPGFDYVLHPTDLSEAGRTAFVHALRLAVAARGHFYLVHAAAGMPDQIGNWSLFPGVRGTLGRWGMLANDASPSAVFQELGLRVTKSEIPGRDPVEGVAHFLAKNPCNFMVLATSAQESQGHWMRRSIAQALARRSGLPALFLPTASQGFVDPATGASSLRNILLLDEEGVDAAPAAAAALRLASLLGSDDALLHASDRAADAAAAWPEARLRRVETGSGNAEPAAADLVVLPTRSPAGRLEGLLGSRAEHILHSAARPLLAVPTA